MDKLVIIKKIKEKKSLNNLDDKLVLEKLENYLIKNNIKIENLNERSANFKKIVKELRNDLNRTYGCFNLDDKFSLESNSSTKERMKIYPRLYENIFKITGKPETIVDLSCGFNPLSYSYINFKPKFIVSELNENDCKRLENYFKDNKIDGKVLQIDLTKFNKLPEGEICFLFKVLDIIETKGHRLAERIIRELKCKFIVVSFSTRSLKGEKMKFPRRTWFEVMLTRLGLNFEKLEYENELFYVINKE